MTTDTKFIESDVNRLARNDEGLQHSILQTKEDARTKEVPIANEEKSIIKCYARFRRTTDE